MKILKNKYCKPNKNSQNSNVDTQMQKDSNRNKDCLDLTYSCKNLEKKDNKVANSFRSFTKV